MARLVNFKADCDIIEIYDYCGEGGIFVHCNLLREHSSYFKTLVDKSKPITIYQDQPSIELDLSYNACSMLARWLYGQPLCANNHDPETDLTALALLHDFIYDTLEESGTKVDELADACLDAIRQCLAQKAKTLRDPIEDLQNLLVRENKYPGKAVVLRELIYGECATDGRTRASKWLEEHCGPELKYGGEVVKVICMEFAKKACEQSQNNSSSNSASTTN